MSERRSRSTLKAAGRLTGQVGGEDHGAVPEDCPHAASRGGQCPRLQVQNPTHAQQPWADAALPLMTAYTCRRSRRPHLLREVHEDPGPQLGGQPLGGLRLGPVGRRQPALNRLTVFPAAGAGWGWCAGAGEGARGSRS